MKHGLHVKNEFNKYLPPKPEKTFFSVFFRFKFKYRKRLPIRPGPVTKLLGRM